MRAILKVNEEYTLIWVKYISKETQNVEWDLQDIFLSISNNANKKFFWFFSRFSRDLTSVSNIMKKPQVVCNDRIGFGGKLIKLNWKNSTDLLFKKFLLILLRFYVFLLNFLIKKCGWITELHHLWININFKFSSKIRIL